MTATGEPLLFTPFDLGRHRLKNRIVNGSISTRMGDRGRITDRLIRFHQTRAQGGAAMIVTEAMAVGPTAAEASRVWPFDPANADALKRWAARGRVRRLPVSGAALAQRPRPPDRPGDQCDRGGGGGRRRQLDRAHELSADEVRALTEEFVGTARRPPGRRVQRRRAVLVPRVPDPSVPVALVEHPRGRVRGQPGEPPALLGRHHHGHPPDLRRRLPDRRQDAGRRRRPRERRSRGVRAARQGTAGPGPARLPVLQPGQSRAQPGDACPRHAARSGAVSASLRPPACRGGRRSRGGGRPSAAAGGWRAGAAGRQGRPHHAVPSAAG